MRTQLLIASYTIAVAAGGSAILAAPDQTLQAQATPYPGQYPGQFPGQVTQYPGQMTEARVWIQNRDRREAVPISLQEVALDSPLRVQVVNGPLAAGSDEPVNVRVVPQPRIWEYQSVTVKTGENVAAALSTPGAAGWETTGIVLTGRDGTTLLLKRLR